MVTKKHDELEAIALQLRNCPYTEALNNLLSSLEQSLPFWTLPKIVSAYQMIKLMFPSNYGIVGLHFIQAVVSYEMWEVSLY
jgi:hypothetical protein